jgi:biopolymer transport protein ExbB
LLEHIQKGGLVAYAIIGVGLLALAMIVEKVRDLSLLAPDSPGAVRTFLSKVARGEWAEAELAARALKRTTRELFEVGLQHSESPKDILEEHLQSVLLRQRLHFERRLQLLAVIATAAPLMGLLGTVIGMVKTFALITVFGTGNAGKLASGISQVLVATELGLVVAIPTLIAHGFLAQRIQWNLSLLERYALEFVTATETARAPEKSIN